MLSKKWISLAAILAVAAAGTAWGVARWRHGQVFIGTDNAYVKGHVTSVASRIPGPLLTVEVTDNQFVRAGQVLATVDPRDFDANAARAEASLQEASSSVTLDQARVAQAQAQVEAALSQKKLAETELARFKALYERQSIAKQKFDHVQTQAEVAGAQVDAARKQVAAAQGLLSVSRGKVAGAQAALAAAKLQRSYCTIVAPCDGYVSRKMGEAGMVVAPGQPICAIVPLGQEEVWIEANFKETQLRRVRPGQPVKLVADLDEKAVFGGRVESISAGTGAAFSLLPAENATGNWVKVVQRVPVRIKLDPGADPAHRLRLGLTVSAEIDTRD
ncbi:HlyD family secretion protein [Mesoterricola sediminis]|uniref:RND transporter n=1 Tax=Mesoterricola sediminis TaxID=2927980 RepID=A0AA48KDC0_9BACT|nr:HlyD family secretion protein [Mesoterricola sediminis]BDU78124.1 RND transporter [Mesoterricola sediminis]